MAGRRPRKTKGQKPTKTEIKAVDLKTGPHNGEGRPDLQFPDPINGEMIGGQTAFMRMAMRARHTVCPWARRQGKTTGRMFTIQNEATITPGPYYAGIAFPDHTTAAKIASAFKESWGPMVKDFKINDKDQDRWIELHPLVPPPGKPPPTWFTPSMKKRWTQCQGGDRNTSVKIYFWGAAHPHYQRIQGFPHKFDRVDWDECANIHPKAYAIVRPMIRDSRGHESFSGTPDSDGIGNVQFEKWWRTAGEIRTGAWFRMRIPDGSNPYVPPTPLDEARKTMTEKAIRETLFAEFLSGEGAIFSNLDRVFILQPLDPGDPSLDWVRALRGRYDMPSMEWWVHRPNPEEGHIYGASIDWARSPRGDYSAMGVYNFTTGEQDALFRWRGEDFTAQMEVVLAIQQHYGASQLHSDQNGMGEAMSDFLRRRHALGFVGHRFGRNKGDYVRRAQIMLQDEDIALIDCPVQRNEFKIFSAYESDGLGSEKQIKYCAPEGEHDDTVAQFLQIAPTVTIVGRQKPPEPEPEVPPTFDSEGRTTLELFAEGAPTPWDRGESEGMSWQDVILPPSYR